MAVFSLRTAAQQAGTSKSTILRAIKSGRLSATKTAAGGYEIDGAELSRVYPPKTSTVAPQRSTHRTVGHDATADATDTVAPETAVLIAVLDTEVKALKAMVDELRQARDQWQAQAERTTTLALTAPATSTASTTRPWWWRKAG